MNEPTPSQAAEQKVIQIDSVEAYGLVMEGEEASPLFGDRAAAEDFRYPWNKDRRAYGALPHLKSAEESVNVFLEEAKYFGRHYTPKEPGAPEWRDASFAEGMILFEAKFGKKLSDFTEEILQHYPQRAGGNEGKELHVFGLSGSGKSTAIEAIKESLESGAVVMDSDTVRFNLLAKMVKEVEMTHGASLLEVRQHLLHNNLSGALYLLLNHVKKELTSRGYNIISASVMPETGTVPSLYLPHPDGIDPRTITDEQIPEVAKRLFERTQARVQGDDNYDWEHAETITDFNQMSEVTVQVPERVHGSFLKNIRTALSQPDIHMLQNERIDDPIARKEAYKAQLEPIIQAMSHREV